MNGRYNFFVLHDKKCSSHITQMSECINSSNNKINSYDQMKKMIVNLGSKKCEDRNNSTCQQNHHHNLSIVIIAYTPQKDKSKVDGKINKRKICKYSIKSSSILFSCSICGIYNIFHHSQNKRLMLK